MLRWLKPLQQALSLEVETGFNNLQGRQQRFDGFLIHQLSEPPTLPYPPALKSVYADSSRALSVMEICRKAAADGWSPTRANGCMSCDSGLNPLRRWHHHGCDWCRQPRLHPLESLALTVR